MFLCSVYSFEYLCVNCGTALRCLQEKARKRRMQASMDAEMACGALHAWEAS